jgi:hypothetical protein
MIFSGIFSKFFKKNMEKVLQNTSLNSEYNQQFVQPYQMMDIIKNSSSVNSYLISNFFNITKSKKELIEEIDNLRDFYLSQLIVNRIIEDAFTPTIDQDFFKPIVNIDGKFDESLTQILEEFTHEMNLKKIILDIAPDTLYYGEMFLRLDVNDYTKQIKGVINIHDDVDLTKIIPVFRDSQVSYFLKFDPKEKKLKSVPNTQYVYFHLPSNRIKVKVNGLDDKVLYVRMGQSILYPIFGLLKELKFLEELMPIGMMKQMQKIKIVGVSIPAGTKPAEALEIARVYQKMIDKAMVSNEQYTDKEELLKSIQSKLGSIKVIPVWNDKGSLESQDIESDNNFEDIQQKIEDLRVLALKTLGVPTNLITQDNDILKTDIIKSYNMYTKKLKVIQDAMAFGLKQLYTIHLQNLGYTDIYMDNIEIVWNNTLDYEALQKIELVDILVSSFDNINNFIDDLEQKENIEVNKKQYVDYMNTQFKNVMGFNLFEYKEEENSDEI